VAVQGGTHSAAVLVISWLASNAALAVGSVARRFLARGFEPDAAAARTHNGFSMGAHRAVMRGASP